MRKLRGHNSELSLGKSLDGEEIDFDKLTPYNALKYISERTEGSGLNKEFWDNEKVSKSLSCIRQVLPLNDKQIVLISIIGAYTLGSGGASIRDIGNKMDISPFELFEMQTDVDELLLGGMLECTSDAFMDDIEYRVNKELLCNLRDNKNVVKPQKPKLKSNLDFIKYMSSVISKCRGSLHIIEKITVCVCETNSNINLLKRMEEKGLSNLEQCVLIILFDLMIREEDNIPISKICQILSDDKNGNEMYDFKNYLADKNSKLVKLKYVETLPSHFSGNNCIRATPKAINELLPKDKNKLLAQTCQRKNDIQTCTVIKPRSIYEKQLVYDDKTNGQVQILQDILSDAGLRNLQTNLKKQGLRSGINVLLFGHPGTGKTETVLQLCKKCGREVLQVNISEMKSCWFGQSEKIVNELFDKYSQLIRHTRKTPVLLFNEADGVLSRRKQINDNDGCGQTENTIQNIILQHFENNEGIIICTTNMIKNLDEAFGRRFLYKIEFSKPDSKTVAALIKLKLGKYLSANECLALAGKYPLTGGILDNIATKIIASQCLYNKQPTYSDIDAYCRQDIGMGASISRVGF